MKYDHNELGAELGIDVAKELQNSADIIAARYRVAFQATDCPERVSADLPRPARVIGALDLLLQIFLPGRFAEVPSSDAWIEQTGKRLKTALRLLGPECDRAYRCPQVQTKSATNDAPAAQNSQEALRLFARVLPRVFEFILLDIEAAYLGDPAALSYSEVKLTYPGIVGIVVHRIAHELNAVGVPLIPRIMSEWAHSQTGLDIHPGAQIGAGFFVDHCTGVVVGETARIGKNVKLYQGVTLGAKSFALDELGNPVKSVQRHPTLEDDVVVYANATILGGDTVVGKGSTIGGNVFLTQSVPPGSVVLSSSAGVTVKGKIP